MTMPIDTTEANELSRAAWEANAAHWDRSMRDEGNDFVKVLIWPAVERLLGLSKGERVLDAACGNGLYAHRFAELGAAVVAFDFSAELIARARARAVVTGDQIRYSVLDATDLEALLTLGEGQFDAASCQMALFDMPAIEPLMEAVVRLLRPGGRFVFSIMHPAFNGLHAVHMAEARDDGTAIRTHYFMRVERYLSPRTDMGIAIKDQPAPQPYFHRSLSDVLGACFAAGLVVDALEERAFPPGHPHGSSPISWGGNYSEFPPVLVVRARRLARKP
jgi:SAM-dependent methyltransferase